MDWLNVIGLAVMICVLFPNAVYAVRTKGGQNHCTNRAINIIEQVGRYGSMFMMIFNIGLLEYGFASDEAFALWLLGTAALILLYWIFWIIYIFRKNIVVPMALAIIPSIIFIGTGIAQRHIIQILFGTVFAVGHIYITFVNSVKASEK